ncbi:M48 family metalloprotease, partial [Aquabacterium sp.]|uniref:M48 family metalloprotease n=1 Tax=Aquabacterium sp. TaxID=1872578 RepID=UPI0035B43678
MSDPHHPDKALQALRQVSGYFTLLLLALLVAVAGALTLVALLLPPYDPQAAWPLIGAATGLVAAGILARVGWTTRQLRRHGGAWVAQWAHGRLIDEPTGPIEGRLVLITQGLAQYLNQPRPEVYVLEREDSINAFIAGWSARDAALAVTRGALDALSASELQALVAHEFGHMPTDDMRLNMVLLPRVLGFSWVYGWGRSLMQARGTGTRPHLLRWAAGSLLLTLGWPGWVAAKCLQAVACDRHEYQADASAVRVTLDRRGLGNTLRKIWYQNEYTDVRLRHPQADALATMLFHNPQAWRVLNTHPELQDRIRRVLGRDRAPIPPKRAESAPSAAAPAAAPVAPREPAAPPARPPARVVAQTPPSTDFERTVATVMAPAASPPRRPADAAPPPE